MIVYKFGGALARSKRGLEAIARLVGETHVRELTRARRSAAKKPVEHGLVVIVSAIGHTTRYLARAAEFAEEGKLPEAESTIDRIVAQHEQLAATLALDGEEDLFETFEEIGTSVRSLLEGIAITRGLSTRTRDAVIAHGEEFAMALIHALLVETGLPVHIIDSRNVFVTNETFGHAVPDAIAVTERAQRLIAPRLRRSEVVLLQGFVGATPDGITTTMGSESSDLTATVLAASLGAEEVVIWKMLPGIYSADPELVPRARLVRALSFTEAEEIGRRGARVLFPTFAHPLLRSKSRTVLRIATPFGTGTRHTLLTREVVPRPGKQKAIAVAIEDKLVSLRIAHRGGSEPPDRRARERMDVALAGCHARWSTPEETVAIIPRDSRRAFLTSFDREFAVISEGSALAAVAVVVRKTKSEPFDADLVTQIGRSLRSLNVHALIPIEQSLIAFVDESQGREALRKVHHALFEA